MSPAETPVSGSAPAPWHAMRVEEVEKALRVDPNRGLEGAEAAERLRTYGPNRLPQGKKQGPLTRFLAQFNNILVYVLLTAGFIKLMLSLWLGASIIFAVVVLNSLLGFLQEGRAEKALDSIRNMLSAEARAIRDGETRLIPAEDLTPGDIVLLESGDKIPADLRLMDAKNLRTEEAALTGESVPAEKSTDVVAAKATVGDRENMAFSGTMPAVETLGSVSRICSDKTGTLTLMEMMVTSVVTSEEAYDVTGDGYAPEGEIKEGARRSARRRKRSC